MIEWRIYYTDQTYTNLDGPPEFAPKRDVQVIVQRSARVGWEMLRATNYYVFRDDRWDRIEDEAGFYDYMFMPGVKIVLFGRKISDAEFQDIYYRAKAARDFGIKQGFLPHEGQPEQIV